MLRELMTNPEHSSTYHPWLPCWTLVKKEILRFLSVWSQTLLAPVVSASLYMLIFGLSLGSKISLSPHFTYAQYVVPGLVLMGILNNSFANVSSSLFMARYLGNIADLLVTPLSPLQYIIAYTLGALVRGLLVGSIILGVTCFFTTLPWPHPVEALAMAAMASFLFAQLGLWAALFATSFDTLSMFTNFLILPLTYLGGLFYPVASLPSPWREISLLNPLYYLIEGFRYASLGHSEISFFQAFWGALALGCCLSIGSWWFFAKSHRLRN